MTIAPILPLSPERRQYPFPQEHKWIEGETFEGDLIKALEGSIKTLSSNFLYGGTAQFYIAYANGFYAVSIVKSPLVVATDVQTVTLEASKKITSVDIETQTLEALQKITSKDIETQTLEVTQKAEIGNLSIESNSITALNQNGNVELYPSREDGSTGKLILGLLSLFQDEFSSSTKKISFLNIADDEAKTKRGISLSDNVISTVLQNDPLLLSPNGSGEVQSTSDLRVLVGKALILEKGDKTDSISISYTQSLKNFFEYTWPQPESLVPLIPVPGISFEYLTKDDKGNLIWDSFLGTQLLGGTIGPYLSYDELSPTTLLWRETDIPLPELCPDVQEKEVGPFLTRDSSGKTLSWKMALVIIPCIPELPGAKK
jgi:hypothetical protein